MYPCKVSNAAVGLLIGGPRAVINSLTVTDCRRGLLAVDEGTGLTVTGGLFTRTGAVTENAGYGIFTYVKHTHLSDFVRVE